MSGKSPAADSGSGSEDRKGYGETTAEGPLELSVDDLPKYGLLCTTEYGGKKVHRVGMAVGRQGETYERNELRPPCTQAEVPQEKNAVNGREYRQQWRTVLIARRIPFAGYDLCRDSDCFAGVEVVDDDG